MGTSPKVTVKKAGSTSPVQSNATTFRGTDQSKDSKQEKTSPIKIDATEPLAPPPRPGQQLSQQPQGTPDYFSTHHGNLQSESNPFERSFAGGGSDTNSGSVHTPGGTKLPSVAALTSPAGLLGSGTTPNFWGGLRSGSLSPAMLSGPQKEDYFSDGHHLSRGFTPNESGLRSGLTPGGDTGYMRSGLTPGGGGSMFPEPSPNTLYNPLQGGGATPGTLEFRNTAINAIKAQPRSEAQTKAQPNVTSQPQNAANGVDVKPQVSGNLDSHDNDAANGLFLLSHARPQGTQGHYSVAPQMPVHGHPQSSAVGQSNGTSPTMDQQRSAKSESISAASGRGVSEASGGYSDENEQKGPTTRNKSKRSAAQNNPSNGRCKAEDTASKPPAKRSKGNKGAAHAHMEEPEPPSEEELDLSKEQLHPNGRKMTDEEKRKNFLERNRVAALKCRQRKKQWLANLQQKVEIFSSENDNLTAQINHLREELVNLKTLLLAHKDCPVSQQQGISGMHMQAVMDGGYSSQMNPYGMAAAMGNSSVMPSQPMPDRS